MKKEEANDVQIEGGDGPRLGLLWPIALLVVFGPYLAIVHGIPWLVQSQGWEFIAATSESLAASLNPGYWIVMAIYVVIAGLVTPEYDPENLGLFGSRHIDNPFSMQDDQNRAMRKLSLLLLPGKCVWFAGVGTLQAFRNRSGSG